MGEDEDEWDDLDDLTQARLNVLERQGRVEEDLDLCQQAGEYFRYALKLLSQAAKSKPCGLQ